MSASDAEAHAQRKEGFVILKRSENLLGSLSGHTYEYKTIVIGGSYDALKHASNNDLPIIVPEAKQPYPWEKDTHDEWSRLLFSLSMLGLRLIPMEIQSFRIQEENRLLKIVTRWDTLFRVGYEELIIFDIERVSGLSPKISSIETNYHRVIDRFSLKPFGSCKPISSNIIVEQEEKFINKVELFNKKGFPITLPEIPWTALVFSKIARGGLNDFKYSDVITRLVLDKKLAQAGFRGRSLIEARYARAMKLLKREGMQNITFSYDLKGTKKKNSHTQDMLERLIGSS